MGRITEEQRKIIESFSCERLSYREENKELIKSFSSVRGRGLVNYLQSCAWQDDIEGNMANYLIKSSEGDVVLFFSLKCGSLFDPLDEKTIEERAQWAQELLGKVQAINADGQERDLAIQLLERIRSGRDIPLEQIKNRIKLNAQQAQEFLRQLNYDKEHEENGQIIRVGHTYPGIDLVNFCLNDSAKEKWKQCNLKHPIGKILFWEYIAPIICKVQNYVGCQYIFLFAADTSEDGTLINYYDVELKFKQPTDIGTNKPRYDLCCQFMCETISELKQNREEFFDKFNPNEDDIIA